MSTFSKSDAKRFPVQVSDTPGPGEYLNNTSTLLDNDQYKRYGFLGKSNRFLSKSVETLSEIHTTEEENIANTSHIAPKMFNHDQKEREQLLKLKKEHQKMQQQYEKLLMDQDKEIINLTEKINRVDAQCQILVKEKNTLQTTSTLKEKQLSELSHKHNLLRSKLDKNEKTSMQFHQTSAKSEILQKKIDDLEKQNGKFKSISEKKLAQENDTLKQDIQKIKLQLKNLMTEKETISTSLLHISQEKKALKLKYTEINDLLQTSKEAWSVKESKLKEEAKELTKRYITLTEKFQNQKEEFTGTVQSLNKQCDEYKDNLASEAKTFELQKQAYLTRINQLETDLEITERALMQKDSQIENLKSQLSQVNDNLSEQLRLASKAEAEHSDEILKLKKQIELGHEDLVYQLSTIQNELKSNKESHEKQRAQLEDTIRSLESNLEQYQLDQESTVKRHQFDLDAKNQSLENFKKQVEFMRSEINLVKTELKAKTESNDLVESKLATSIAEAKQRALEYTNRLNELQTLVEDQKNKMDGMQVKHQEELHEKDNAFESLNAKYLKIKADLELSLKSLSEKDSLLSDLKNQIVSHQNSYNELAENYELTKCDQSEHMKLTNVLKEKLSQVEKELESKLSEQEHQLKQWKVEYKELNLTIESKTKEITHLEHTYSNAIKGLQEALQHEKSSSENFKAEKFVSDQTFVNELEKIRDVVDGLNGAVKQKDAELMELKQKYDAELLEQKIAFENEKKVLCDRAKKEEIYKKDIEQQLESLKIENERLSFKYTETKSTLIDMEQFGVKEQLSWEKQRKDLREQISKKDNHIQELESTLNKVKSDFNSELKSNQSSLLDAQKQNIALTTELNQKKSRIEKLEIDLISMKSHSDSLLDQLENTKTSLCKSERSVLELTESKKLLEMKSSDAEKELLTQLESLQSDNVALEKELELIKKSNEAELLKSEKLCHQLDAVQADYKKHHSELVTLQHEYQECQVKLELAKKKGAQLTEQHEESVKTHNSQISSLSKEIEDQNSIMESLNSKIKSLSTSVAEKDREISELNGVQETLTNECTERIKEISNWKIRYSEMENLNDLQNEEISTFKRSNADLHKQLSGKQEEVSLLKANISELSLKNTELLKEFNTAKEALEANGHDNQMLKQNNEHYVEEINVLTKKVVESEQKLKEQKLLINSKNDDLSAVNDRVTRMSLTIQDLQSILTEKQLELEEKCNAETDLKLQLDQLRKQQSILAKELEDSKSSIETANRLLAESNENMKKKEVEATQNKTRRDELENEIVKFTETLAELQSSLTEKNQTIKKQNEECEKLQQYMEASKVEWNSSKLALEQKLKTSEERLVSLTSEHDKLKEAHESLSISSSTQLTASKNTLEQVISQCHGLKEEIANLEVSLNRKDGELVKLQQEIESLNNELSSVVEQHQSAELLLSKRLQEAEKKFGDEKLALFQSSSEEMQQMNMKMKEAISSKDHEINNLKQEYQMVKEELNRVHGAAKVEFGHLTERLEKSENKSKEFNEKYELLQKELQMKDETLRITRTELESCRSVIDKAELQTMNERSKHDIIVDQLETRCREMERNNAKLEASLKQTVAEKDNLIKLTDSLVAKKVTAQVEKESIRFKQQLEGLQQEISNKQEEYNKRLEQIDSLKTQLETSVREKEYQQEVFDSQLKLFQSQNRLKTSEIQEIGEMNAKLFGHLNSKQKIRHVENIKKENLELKAANLGLVRERDGYRRKAMIMERELEGLKDGSSVVVTGKMSRVGRNANKHHFTERKPLDTMPINEELDNEKENAVIKNMEGSGGGVSFIIE